MIAETELRCERQIAALREQVADLVAKRAQPGEVVATSLSDDLIEAWAKGTVPFIRECIAPLSARLDEIEEVVRSLVKARARNDG